MPDGLDDVAWVTTLLLARPTCLLCLMAKAAIGAARVEAALVAIEGTILLQRTTERCRGCGTIGSVFFVDRPPQGNS